MTDAYACTGAVQTSTAPAGTIAAVITLTGAAGTESAYDKDGDNPEGGQGGVGDSHTVSVPASAGQQFDVNVGCQNGHNGGNRGGYDGWYGLIEGDGSGGGNGGGASDVTPTGEGYVSGAASAIGAASPAGTGDGSVRITFPASVSTSSTPFGSVPTGQTSPRTVQVTNTGYTALNLGQASITGTKPDKFSNFAPADHCSNQSVAPGASCSVQVRFIPTSAGSLTATLQIPSNATNGAAIVALSGTGVRPPTVGFSSPSVDFGQVTVGQTSEPGLIGITHTAEGRRERCSSLFAAVPG